jgi:hypothetical protein
MKNNVVFRLGALFCAMWLVLFSAHADFKIKSGKIINQNNGPIYYDLNDNGLANMTMSVNGFLGVGVLNPQSTLDIKGSFGLNFELVSGNKVLSGNSMILVDSSSGNVALTLPEATTVNGRVYNIKKTALSNKMTIKTNNQLNKIDGHDKIVFNTHASSLSYINMVSSAGNWYVTSMSSNVFVQQTVAADNIMAWWKLNELGGGIAYDASINGNDGAINNFSAGNIGVSGRINQAHDFDGIDDDISVSDSTSLRPNQNYSIALWVKPKTVNGVHRHIVSKRGPSIISYGIWLFSTSKFYFEVNDGSVHGIQGSTTAVVNTWYHIAATYDGTDLKLYVNGNLDGTLNAPGINISYNTNDLFIGSGAFNTNFHGLIDEITIYDYPLTQSDIFTLYSE